MNKFLKISGIVFWVQILVLIFTGLFLWYDTLETEKEVENHFINFSEQYLLKQGNMETYFLMSSFTESDEIIIKSSLESLGDAIECIYKITEVSRPDNEAAGVIRCIFDNAKADIKISSKKYADKWLVTEISFTSDILK
jgi:hypothetical protein